MCGPSNQLQQTVAAVCHLMASSTAVRAIQVVTDRRPSYSELMRFRELAQAHDLTLIVLGSGGFMLRSCSPAAAGADPEGVDAG